MTKRTDNFGFTIKDGVVTLAESDFLTLLGWSRADPSRLLRALTWMAVSRKGDDYCWCGRHVHTARCEAVREAFFEESRNVATADSANLISQGSGGESQSSTVGAVPPPSDPDFFGL